MNQLNVNAPLGQQTASYDTDCVVDELDPSTRLERIKLLTKVVEEQRGEISALRRQLADKSREISDKERVIEQLESENSVLHNERLASLMEGELEPWRIRSDEFAKNFDRFSQSDALVRLTADQLADLFSRDDLHVSNEGIVLEALLTWIQSDEYNNYCHLLRLLELVRLKYVDLDRLGDLLMRYEDSQDGEQVTRLVQRVILNRSLPHVYPIEETEPRTGMAKIQEARLSQSLATVVPTLQREVIVVVGGSGIPGDLDSVEYFDPVLQAWNQLPRMTTKRVSLAVVTLNNKLYAIGGRNESDGDVSTVEVYDPLVGSWKLVAPMSQVRSAHSVTVHSGYIYVVGGINGINGINGIWNSPLERYDPDDNVWTTLDSMRMPRNGHSLTSLGSYLYAIGGSGRDEFTSLERYDPTTNEWQLFEDVPGLSASGHAAVPFERMDGKRGIYLIGGDGDLYPSKHKTVDRLIIRGSGEELSDFVVESCSSLNSGRYDVSATVSDDTIYVTGGYDDSECQNTMETIPLGNMFSGWNLHAAKMSQGRHCHGSSTLRL